MAKYIILNPLFEINIIWHWHKHISFFALLKSQHEKENIDENNLNMFKSYILNIKIEFESRFQSFKKHCEMFTFIIKPDEKEENVVYFQYFEYWKYIKIDNLRLKITDFKNST